MSLQKQIEKDFIEAMKAKEENKISALRMLKTALKNKSIEIGKEKELDDHLIAEIVAKEIKARKESIVEYEKGARADLVQKEKAEIEALEKYLPEQLSEEEISKIVEKAIQKSGASGPQDIGRVMAQVMPHLKGKAEGSLVSKIVKERLAE